MIVKLAYKFIKGLVVKRKIEDKNKLKDVLRGRAPIFGNQINVFKASICILFIFLYK